MYVGYIQFLMIVLMFFKDTRIGDWIFSNVWLAVPIAFVVLMLVSVILGRIDTLLGLRQEELRNNSENNPVISEILKEVKEIKEKLDDKRN